MQGEIELRVLWVRDDSAYPHASAGWYRREKFGSLWYYMVCDVTVLYQGREIGKALSFPMESDATDELRAQVARHTREAALASATFFLLQVTSDEAEILSNLKQLANEVV